MSDKIILCRCEDVTLKDCEHAVELGYGNLEEVKRYTGFGTGPCQGKECLALVARVLVRLTNAEGPPIAPFTARPPSGAITLGALAAAHCKPGDGDPK